VKRDLAAEFIGSALLSAIVIGSGIMAERLAGGNAAVALLANTMATVLGLATLITAFGTISGAHFNPVVSLVAVLEKKLSPSRAGGYAVAQIAGCCSGAVLANAMFALPLIQQSAHARTGLAQWLSEVIATAGLIFIAFRSPTITSAAWRVPAWIGAAYWFTASTSFANPAITLGRSLSDTFAGIRPADAPGFIIAQVIGALLGALLLRMFAARSLVA
jgi:glycerol uptake facilitator-like aquaporin